MHKYPLWVRLPATAIVISVLAALVVSIVGWISRWNATQFSNGMFIVGAVAIIIAIIFSFNKQSTLPDYYKQQNLPVEHKTEGNGIRFWVQDMTHGYNAFLLMTLVGALLIGLSVWIASFVE